MGKYLPLLLSLLALSAGCGGGGGGGSMIPAPGTIAGTAVKGAVGGGTMTAYAISNGAMGAKITSATTNADGTFKLLMGSYAGQVMLQMTGGTYTDEATGATMPMMSGDAMTAVLPTMTAGQTLSGVQVTPLTAMAQGMAQHMSGGMTDANINAANADVGTYFMVNDILHDVPMDPLTSGSGNGATQDQINYGMLLAAMSLYAQAQGMSSSSAMMTAMMSDASDGVMDGMMSGSDVMMGGMGMSRPLPASAGTTGLAAAMLVFVNSGQNHSGVAASTMLPLMNQLSGSDGQMSGTGTAPGGKVSGRVFNGEMSQGMVTAYALTSGNQGAQIASTAMDSSGEFSMSLGTYAGPMMLQVTGGRFMDEATGTTMHMGASDVMTAVMMSIMSGAEVSGICITAVTSMAQMRAAAMSGGMIDANITAANTTVGNYFMMSNLLTTEPVDMTMAGSGTAGGVTQDEINHGAAIAAMSQYAHGLGMSTSSGFVTAMMDDASDGMMDGMMGSTQIQMGGMMDSAAGWSGMATAMTDFMDSSAVNHSGLTSTNMNALIQALSASNGVLSP